MSIQTQAVNVNTLGAAELLTALASGAITPQDAQARMAVIQAEQAAAIQAAQAAAKAAQKALTCKVAVGGGLSVYGLQRNPVTLYKAQWLRLAEFLPTLLAFINSNPTTTHSLEGSANAPRRKAVDELKSRKHVVSQTSTAITVRLSDSTDE